MLKSRLIVDAILRAAQAEGLMAVVARAGDPDAGAVYARGIGRGGRCCLRTPAMVSLEGRRVWQSPKSGLDTEPEVAAFLKRRTSIDPDIWIVDVDTLEIARFLPPLD